MGMFHRVGDWFSDKSDRFIRGSNNASGGYYASNEAEEAYGQMGSETLGEAMNDEGMPAGDAGYVQGIDPFERAGKDYGGRVPYRSQKQMQEEQAAMEDERQRWLREEQKRAYVQPPQQPIPTASTYQQPFFQGNQPVAQATPHPQGYTQSQGQPVSQPVPQPVSQPVPQAPAQPSNVVPFPGMRQTPDGNVCTHVEYVVLLRSRNECTKVIEYIKTNASVFLNMEFIASDSERQRCVDMLSGAAYTLNCKLSRLSPRGMYLISSPSVYVVIDPSMQGYTSAAEPQSFVRQNYETSAFGGQQRQAAGYASYSQPHREPEQQTSRFAVQAQQAAYAQQAANAQQQSQATQRRPALSFGNVMAGNATASYAPASAFGVAGNQTSRYSTGDFQQ